MRKQSRNFLWDAAMSLLFVSVAYAIQPGMPGEAHDVVVKAPASVERCVPPSLALPVEKKIHVNAQERSEMPFRPALH